MHLRFLDDDVEFFANTGQSVGRYNFRNRFKPSLHPLKTPEGVVLTLSQPHDHLHHRGVMYALSASDINFWEERQVRPNEKVGVQKHLDITETSAGPDHAGLEHRILWSCQDGELDTFEEARLLSCEEDEAGGLVWQWRTQLLALRDLDLIQSHWSHETAGGRKINYHGLGIRFRRDFGPVFSGTQIFLNAEEVDFAEALGSKPAKTAIVGKLDGYSEPRRAGLSISQHQDHVLFACKEPFPMVCLGPSNGEPLSVGKGETLVSSFALCPFDGKDLP